MPSKRVIIQFLARLMDFIEYHYKIEIVITHQSSTYAILVGHPVRIKFPTLASWSAKHSPFIYSFELDLDAGLTILVLNGKTVPPCI